MEIKLIDLQKEMDYQWRVQSFSKNKPQAACVAYIDARDVMRRLDEVCGAENWQDDYRVINGQLFAGIGIFIKDKWVWKWDVGTESQTEKEKGLVSDSFKRAAVKWGVGRFLYDLPLVYVNADAKKGEHDNADTKRFPSVVDEQGKKVFDVTLLINSKNKNNAKR
jgi:hypothetical protein